MITSGKNDLDIDNWYSWIEILRKDFTKLDLQSAIETRTSSAFTTVSNAITEAYIKLHTFGVLLETKNRSLEEKCVSLETTIQDLKEQLNRKCDLSNNASDNGTATVHRPPNDLDNENDLSNYIHSLSPKDPLEENEPENSLTKTPVSEKSPRETSPVVQKQIRSGKRKLRLSSKRKNRTDGDSFNVSPTGYTEPEWIFADASPETKKEVKDSIKPLEESDIYDDASFVEPSPAPVSKNRRINPLFGSKKLSGIDCVNTKASDYVNNNALSPLSVNILENCKMPRPAILEQKNDCSITNDKSIIEKKKENQDSQKTQWDLKKERNVSVNGGKKLRQTTLGTSLLKKPVDISTLDQFKGGIANESNISCVTEPVDMELTNVNNSYMNKYDDKENQSVDDISCTLRPTFLYGAQSEKNKENIPIPTEPSITSQETFFQPDTVPKNNEAPYNEPDTGFPEGYFRVDETSEIVPKVEIGTAFQETFFDPLIASTNKEYATKKSPPVENPPLKNSFDYLPSPENSPKYKYRRDALRKKADRQKLPGQKCMKCTDFYGCGVGGNCDDQARKFSRHRDKYPLHANTPPGLWNPMFDDTDDSD